MSDHSVARTTGRPDQDRENPTTEWSIPDILAVAVRRWIFVLVTSTVAAGAFGTNAFFGTRQCRAIYPYPYIDPGLRSHEVFLHRFYSAENIQNLVKGVKAVGLNKSAAAIEGAAQRGRRDLQGIIDISIWPEYTSRIPINAAEAKVIQETKPDLRLVTIIGPPPPEFEKFVKVIRENIEQVMPMYVVRQENESFAREQLEQITAIRSDQRLMELSLEMTRNIVEGLKSIPAPTSATGAAGLRVEFTIKGGSVEHLPVSYQLQRAESDLTRLEAKQKINVQRLVYHEKMLVLANKLVIEADRHDDAMGRTIVAYMQRLTDQGDALTAGDKDAMSYLKTHLATIKAKTASIAPTVAQPQIVTIARGTVRRTIIAFFISLAICIVLANIWASRKARHPEQAT